MAFIDTLESRRLLSVNLVNGTLRVYLTDAVDSVVYQALTRTSFQMLINGVPSIYNNDQVLRMDIATEGGADTVILGNYRGDVNINGGKGWDSLSGGRGNDLIVGGGGDDYIYGQRGNDTLNGGVGGDILFGGDGDDRMIPQSTPGIDDMVYGGKGADVVDYSGETKNLTIEISDDEPLNVVTDLIRGDVETIIGGSGNDNISILIERDLVVIGGPGNDTITGSSGNERLDGGSGRDLIFANGGNDTLVAGAVDGLDDLFDGGSGTDVLEGDSDSADQILGIP
jgi:Ca2+-binding RTX toxin-like protein